MSIGNSYRALDTGTVNCQEKVLFFSVNTLKSSSSSAAVTQSCQDEGREGGRGGGGQPVPLIQ